jgi:electron transfer flavoprotein alpha subunit
MSTVRPGVFPPGEPDRRRQGKVVRFPVELTEDVIHTRIAERIIGEERDLTQAEVLVIGGRGIDGHFDLMQNLANLIGGEVGSTRPPVDDGQVERERMVGQTGVVCRPKVAIVCGVSGAFHFVVGIQEADTVIAINSDPEAPIFEFADYCIVGDVFEVVPALVAALQPEPEAPEVSHV